MANPQLDQFMQALIWKAVPPIILAGIAGLLLREALRWIERKATGIGRSRQRERGVRAAVTSQNANISTAAPHCPLCNNAMVKRTARRGENAGSEFWGCPEFPRCRETRAI